MKRKRSHVKGIRVYIIFESSFWSTHILVVALVFILGVMIGHIDIELTPNKIELNIWAVIVGTALSLIGGAYKLGSDIQKNK